MNRSISRKKRTDTAARYDRIAPVYDLMEMVPERWFSLWRERLWKQVPPGLILEIGVGTGKNFPYYPQGAEVLGIDISPRMLARAGRRSDRRDSIHLLRMDAEELAFPADTFDAAVSTFVFCSVPHPRRGLQELDRVVKEKGWIFLLEHVRIDSPPMVGRVMDFMDPIVSGIMGPHINRRTEETVRNSGLRVARVMSLAPLDLVKLIIARPGKSSEGGNRA